MRDEIEIERKYLLRGEPAIPADRAVERLEIEQGYLPPDHRVGSRCGGRLRRQVGADGTTVLLHTIKTGAAPARREVEQRLDAAAFAVAWPATAPHRIRKTRLRVSEPDGGLIWEIDVFRDRDLVLAEVELPAIDHPVAAPAWLASWVVREVTHDRAFGNAALSGIDRDPGPTDHGPAISG